MDTILATMKPFFNDPSGEFHLRELSRILKTNHMTVRKRLKDLVKEGYIRKKKGKIYDTFEANPSKKFLNLKLYHNLEQLSGIVEDIEKAFDYPVIVLFGSYANGTDDKDSDIDIAIISDVAKNLDASKYSLNRKISLHIFPKAKWKEMCQKNKGLVNSICNGIVLSGQLEVL